MSPTRAALLRELSKRIHEIERARDREIDAAKRQGRDPAAHPDVWFWVGHYAGLLEAKRVVKELWR